MDWGGGEGVGSVGGGGRKTRPSPTLHVSKLPRKTCVGKNAFIMVSSVCILINKTLTVTLVSCSSSLSLNPGSGTANLPW
jgi:hypothetical protein